MRFIIVSIILIVLVGCGADKKPDIIYKQGDFWVANFVNNNYPAKAVKDDKIYCNSLLITSDSANRFYCLNLKTGKVDWAVPVKNWAAQEPIICDSFIYYCSYVGDIYKFDKTGRQLWYLAFPSTYGGHFLHPITNNLIVSTVAYGLLEIDGKTGRVIDTIGNGKMGVPFPVFKNDTVFQIINDSLFCKSFTTKSMLWKKKIGNNIGRLFLNNQSLYYFDDSKCLYCLNSRAGEIVWKSDSIFPVQPINPHLEFEKGKILGYFSDLNQIFVMDNTTGKVQEETTYGNLQNNNFLVPAVLKYNVTDGRKTYEVSVANTLYGSFDFRNQFDVTVKEQN